MCTCSVWVAECSTDIPKVYRTGFARLTVRLCIYIDNVFIASRNMQEHIDHVRQVFGRLKQYGVVLKPIEVYLWSIRSYIFGTPYFREGNFLIVGDS